MGKREGCKKGGSDGRRSKGWRLEGRQRDGLTEGWDRWTEERISRWDA